MFNRALRSQFYKSLPMKSNYRFNSELKLMQDIVDEVRSLIIIIVILQKKKKLLSK